METPEPGPNRCKRRFFPRHNWTKWEQQEVRMFKLGLTGQPVDFLQLHELRKCLDCGTMQVRKVEGEP